MSARSGARLEMAVWLFWADFPGWIPLVQPATKGSSRYCASLRYQGPLCHTGRPFTAKHAGPVK